MDQDSVSDNFLVKFDIKGKPVYAIILWQNTKDHLFHIQVFGEEQSWSGDFSYEKCTTFAENFDEDLEQYKNNVKDALKMENSMYTFDFTYVESDSNVAKFYWKRRFKDSTATLVHGFVSVTKDEDAGTKNDIIDFLLEQNKYLNSALEDYKNKTEILKTDLENWKSEFEKFTVTKNSLETTLYGKFVQLLNSKKRRIQELEEFLNNL
ncbi:uncharacterized protein LOC123874996 [Maniola jurtina]|uniref:uncharacterized protein LOC123874996 n=1 Tax=Maniola jurtina TaxID=191418 RepID=UPI001E6872FA|nr:uncharacterized protein LOC123874996 [Maniola jurtina]